MALIIFFQDAMLTPCCPEVLSTRWQTGHWTHQTVDTLEWINQITAVCPQGMSIAVKIPARLQMIVLTIHIMGQNISFEECNNSIAVGWYSYNHLSHVRQACMTGHKLDSHLCKHHSMARCFMIKIWATKSGCSGSLTWLKDIANIAHSWWSRVPPRWAMTLWR